jgi:hypothetical protein
MAVRVVCRACGKRLKLLSGLGAGSGRSARCPKCRTPVDLTPLPEAPAYLPTVALPAPPTAPPANATHLGGLRPPLAQEVPLSLDDEEPLSLDDDPTPAPASPPLRVPVAVIADSLRQFAGPCVAVVVPHGVFLEREPLRPFLYLPVGSRAGEPASGELTVALPDGRRLRLLVEGRHSGRLARDLAAFLSGTGPAPVASDYRRRRGPLVLAALLALGAVAALAGGTVYLLNRPREKDPVPSPVEAPAPTPAPAPAPPPPEPEAGPTRPPSHLDLAYLKGVSALEEGPAEVTALALSGNGNHLAIGYADGTARVWPLEQPTFDPMLPGPKADGPVTRVQFDPAGRVLFVSTPTGVVAAPRDAAPPAPARIPGAPVAIAPELSGDRVRFAAVRGNVVAHRLLSSSFVLNPPAKAKGFAVPAARDEITPQGVTADPRFTNPTFLAWTYSNKLLAGAPDGSVSVWSAQMRPEPANRGHKGPVRAWAASPATGALATGDDKGAVAVWPLKGGKPTVGPVFSTPVVALAFAPSGLWVAALDNTGTLAIADATTLQVVQRKKLPAPARVFAFGPADDLLVLGSERAVEVWWLPVLLK